jgi:hypothetical protein
MGVPSLSEIFDEKYYSDLEGGILESFGRLFKNDLKLYVYPLRTSRDQPLITAENLRVAPHPRDLYTYLMKNRCIESIRGYQEDYLPIFSRNVLAKLRAGDTSWEKMVPPPVAQMIRQRELFGFRPGTRNSLKVKGNKMKGLFHRSRASVERHIQKPGAPSARHDAPAAGRGEDAAGMPSRESIVND